ncbi:MAG: hypothetical protein V2A58_17965, partial [Planctomycetota bacterium]
IARPTVSCRFVDLCVLSLNQTGSILFILLSCPTLFPFAPLASLFTLSVVEGREVSLVRPPTEPEEKTMDFCEWLKNAPFVRFATITREILEER